MGIKLHTVHIALVSRLSKKIIVASYILVLFAANIFVSNLLKQLKELSV